jgi:hypothetical protein
MSNNDSPVERALRREGFTDCRYGKLTVEIGSARYFVIGMDLLADMRIAGKGEIEIIGLDKQE